MTIIHMRKPLLSLRTYSNALSSNRYLIPASSPVCRSIFTSPPHSFAQVRSERLLPTELWFTRSFPRRGPEECDRGTEDSKDNERTLKLGKTLRVLQARLPTLLASPLPPEILSPQIKLHLFPSTHPHLPTVSGRVAYHAALWSAPVAWGRVPLLGNVQLVIISERMVKSASLHTTTDNPPEKESTQNERLIVRWKTCTSSPDNSSIKAKPLYRGIGPREQVNRFRDWLSGNLKGGDEEFAGLFIFEFDEDGRIVAHTIEHAEEGGGADRASRVVNLTDWLIGRAKGKEKIPDLAWIVQGRDRRERIKR